MQDRTDADRIAALERRVAELERVTWGNRPMGPAATFPSSPFHQPGCVCPVGAGCLCAAMLCPRRVVPRYSNNAG